MTDLFQQFILAVFPLKNKPVLGNQTLELESQSFHPKP